MDAEKHILVVDDEDKVLLILRHTLMKLGDEYKIATASSGREALKKAKDLFIDLLVTDLRMPGMDGVELTEAIRGLYPEAAVIWITAYRSAAMEAKAEQLSVCRFLDKPVRIEEIRKIVQETLEASESMNGG